MTVVLRLLIGIEESGVICVHRELRNRFLSLGDHLYIIGTVDALKLNPEELLSIHVHVVIYDVWYILHAWWMMYEYQLRLLSYVDLREKIVNIAK